MKCPNCGADNPDYAFYCGKCAKELRTTTTTSKEVEIPLGEPRPFDVLTPWGRAEQSRERVRALRSELQARGIVFSRRAKMMGAAVVVLMWIGIALIVLSSGTFFHPGTKGLVILPPYFFVIGAVMLFGDLALLLLLARRSARKADLISRGLSPK